VVGGASSGVLPMATSAVKGVYNSVTRGGGQNRAGNELARTLTQGGADEATVLRQTIDRLRQAQQGDIPLSTAAQLKDPALARLEQGSRSRNGANWYDFDQNQAASVASAVRGATASADDLAARRALRDRNINLRKNQAFSGVNESAWGNDIGNLSNTLESAMRSPDASNPAVLNMLRAVQGEMDRLGDQFGPQNLATIRQNLSAKFNPTNRKGFVKIQRTDIMDLVVRELRTRAMQLHLPGDKMEQLIDHSIVMVRMQEKDNEGKGKLKVFWVTQGEAPDHFWFALMYARVAMMRGAVEKGISQPNATTSTSKNAVKYNQTTNQYDGLTPDYKKKLLKAARKRRGIQ